MACDGMTVCKPPECVERTAVAKAVITGDDTLLLSTPLFHFPGVFLWRAPGC